MRKTLIALATAGFVLTGAVAEAGTTPPVYTVHGGTPVLSHPRITVTGKPPILSHRKSHRVVEASRITALPRTGGLYTPGLEVGAFMVLAGAGLTLAGRRSTAAHR